MWKKFREATSNLTLNSVTNIFRSLNYDKFESDSETNNGVHVKISRDEENNVVEWTGETENVNTELAEGYNSAHSEDEEEEDYGFKQRQKTSSKGDRFSLTNTQPSIPKFLTKTPKESDERRSRNKVTDIVDGFAQRRYRSLDSEMPSESTGGDENSENKDYDTNTLVFHKADDVHNIPKESVRDKINSVVSSKSKKISRSLSRRKQNGHSVVPNPKSEVKDIVDSFNQRRYQPLEDNDEDDSCQYDNDDNDENMDKTVFNKAEDVHVDLKPKSSKLKGTKKVQLPNIFRRSPTFPDSGGRRTLTNL